MSSDIHVPLEWNATNNVAWKTPLPGESWSSPIVWGNRVFATTDGGIATCLQTDNGEIVWQERIGGNFSASLLQAARRATD